MPTHLSSPTTSKKQLTAEAGRLLERLNGIASGFRSAAIAIVADAGMGKTHTVEQVLSVIPCTRVLIPISEPWHWLHTRLPVATKPLPVWAEQVFKQLKEQQNLSEKSIAQAVLTYLTALSPVLVHLEDAHEANPAQLALWVTVAQMLGKSKGIGLIITSRLPLSAAFQEFSLQALDQKAATALLNNAAVYPLPPDAINWIYKRSLGNPLFTLEFFQHALRQGFLWQVQKQWFWQEPIQTQTIPKDLEAIIIERLEDISQQIAAPSILRQVLLSLALLPNQPNLRDHVFATWSEQMQNVYHLELFSTGIWSANQFVHPLYPEVLRSKMWLQEKISIARELIAPTLLFAPELIEYLVETAQLEPKQTLDVWLEVARLTAAKGNKHFAGRAFAYAVQLTSLEEKSSMAFQAAELLKPFDRTESARLYEIAFRLEPDNPEFILGWCLALQLLGRSDEAEQILIKSAPEKEFDVAWLAAFVQFLAIRGDYQKVISIWQQHPDLQQQLNPVVNWSIAMSLIQLSRQVEAFELIDQTLSRPVELSARLRLFNVKALGLRILGQFTAAEALFTQTLNLLQEHPEESSNLWIEQELLISNRGLVRMDLGRKQEGLHDLETSLQLMRDLADPFRYSIRQAAIASSITYLGQFERAELLLLEAQNVLSHATGDWLYLTSVHLQLAYLYMEWSPPFGEILACKHTKDALRYQRLLTSKPQLARNLADIAWIEALHGDPSVALTLIDEQIELAQKLELTSDLAKGMWVRARTRFALGFIEESKQEMIQALKTLEDTDTSISFERFALEFDYLFSQKEAAALRIRRLKELGDEAISTLHVAKRYFPEMFNQSQQTTQTNPQKLEVLGEMRYATQTISKRLKKARELLALLLEARLMGRVMVTQLEMIDTLYPEENEEQAASALRQLIYRLRKSLGSEIVQHTTLGYCLGVRTDAEDFLETLDTTIWRGVYLEDEISLNPSVQEALSEALTRAITQSLPINPTEATRASRILLNMNPFERPALRLHVQALEASLDSSLNSFYQVQQEQYQKIGESLPSSWQEFILLPE